MIDTVAYIEACASEAICIWFTAWILRRKYELDETMDRPAWAARLGLIALGIVSLCFRSPSFEYGRLFFAGLAVVVLAWPNLAWRISRVFAKGDRDDYEA
jgi:hypothetical protein